MSDTDRTKKPSQKNAPLAPPPEAPDAGQGDWEVPASEGADADALGLPPLLGDFPELEDVFSTLGAEAFPTRPPA